ncbi:MAG: hypothetical protein R3E93_02230 [Thiothrix sp.]
MNNWIQACIGEALTFVGTLRYEASGNRENCISVPQIIAAIAYPRHTDIELESFEIDYKYNFSIYK